MNDISDKSISLREAKAQAIVTVSQAETIACIRENKVPKGNVFEMAKAAGLLAIKKTSDMIPDCHPLPVEGASFQFEIDELNIHITACVKTIYKTGVEVEAMHGASIAALTIYDMLKPIDKSVAIHSIKLLEKTGGKSGMKIPDTSGLRAAIVVCSDRVSAGKSEDKSGRCIVEALEKYRVAVTDFCVVPDEKELIRAKALSYAEAGIDLVIFTGGTGASPRDVTPEALQPLLEKEFPGVMEAARNYGQQRMPLAMLSRGVAGLRGNTFFLALPGSVRGVEESLHAVLPHLFHLFRLLRGDGHA